MEAKPKMKKSSHVWNIFNGFTAHFTGYLEKIFYRFELPEKDSKLFIFFVKRFI
jgi:hypothetical protein